MEIIQNAKTRSHLFTIRVWVEELDTDHAEWRGKIQRVTSGETLYFRDWKAMEAFVQASLDAVAHGEDSEASLG